MLERRHADTYLELVESLAPDILGKRAAEVTQRLDTDHDNIRAAIDWAVEEGEVEIALRFLVVDWRFWQTRGHLTEARLRADAILAMDGLDSQPPELLSRAFGAAGGITYWQGDIRSTHSFYKRALEEARNAADPLLIAQSLYNFSFAPLDEDKQITRVVHSRRHRVHETRPSSCSSSSATSRASPTCIGRWRWGQSPRTRTSNEASPMLAKRGRSTARSATILGLAGRRT